MLKIIEPENKVIENNKKFLEGIVNEVLDNSENGAIKLDFPLCIPSCKNRKPSLLDSLDQFVDTPIYVFNYESDVELYNWLDLPNVTKVTVPNEYLSIQKMRQFIQNYMGDRTFWLLDDDIKNFMLLNKTKKVSVAQGCKALENCIKAEGKIDTFSIASYTNTDIAAKKYNYKNISITAVTAAAILINGKLLNEKGVKYSGNKNINEDKEIAIYCKLKGIPTSVYFFGVFQCLIKMGSKKSFSSGLDIYRNFNMESYVVFGNNLRLSIVNRKAGPTLRSTIVWKNLSETPTWDPVLLELCKTKNYDGLIEELIRRKNNGN